VDLKIRYRNSLNEQISICDTYLCLFICAALVTLKHGEEAESCIALLNKTMLKDKQVEVSLYRNDNLLCITNLPLMMEDADFRKFAEPFGQIEKGFLMRNDCG